MISPSKTGSITAPYMGGQKLACKRSKLHMKNRSLMRIHQQRRRERQEKSKHVQESSPLRTYNGNGRVLEGEEEQVFLQGARTRRRCGDARLQISQRPFYPLKHQKEKQCDAVLSPSYYSLSILSPQINNSLRKLDKIVIFYSTNYEVAPVIIRIINKLTPSISQKSPITVTTSKLQPCKNLLSC